jgi:hypothetical protein
MKHINSQGRQDPPKKPNAIMLHAWYSYAMNIGSIIDLELVDQSHGQTLSIRREPQKQDY